jgi:cytochrome b6-f complex iron-sulfur subunit
LLAVAAGWTSYESLRPLRTTAVGGPLELGNPANFPNDTATYVTEGRLFVANAGGHLFALSQKCTHLGCRVPFCESSGRFECPCHGSKYDLAGEWIEGPAPRGMDRYELRLENGVLVADTSKLEKGPDRGASQFLTPAKGPACKAGE